MYGLGPVYFYPFYVRVGISGGSVSLVSSETTTLRWRYHIRNHLDPLFG